MAESNQTESTNKSNPSNQEAHPAPNSGGFWIGAIMIGLLVFIVVVEMLRSKGHG